MRMGLGIVALFVVTVQLSGAAAAQGGVILVDRSDGQNCVGSPPADEPPAVRGFGFYPWQQNGRTRVRVYELVPAIRDYTAVRLADYVLRPGDRKPILEMKRFGVKPMLLRYQAAGHP